MAKTAITKGDILYTVETEPQRVSLGGRFFTVVKFEVSNGEKEKYVTGGVPLDYTKLGLPANKPDYVEVRAGVILNSFATPTKVYEAVAHKEKLILFQTGAEKGYAPQLEEAQGEALKGYGGYLFVIGH